jgi:hypothetical protein
MATGSPVQEDAGTPFVSGLNVSQMAAAGGRICWGLAGRKKRRVPTSRIVRNADTDAAHFAPNRRIGRNPVERTPSGRR